MAKRRTAKPKRKFVRVDEHRRKGRKVREHIRPMPCNH